MIASFGPMPLTVISFSNSALSLGGKKSEQRQHVLANMGMNVELHGLILFRQRRIGRNRNGHLIADAVHIHNHLIGMLFEKGAAKMGDHQREEYKR